MIQLLYFLLLGLMAWRELPALWRAGARREAVAWAATALAAAALAGWLFWGAGRPGWAELIAYRQYA